MMVTSGSSAEGSFEEEGPLAGGSFAEPLGAGVNVGGGSGSGVAASAERENPHSSKVDKSRMMAMPVSCKVRILADLLQVKLAFAFRLGRLEARGLIMLEDCVDDFNRLVDELDQLDISGTDHLFLQQRSLEPV